MVYLKQTKQFLVSYYLLVFTNNIHCFRYIGIDDLFDVQSELQPVTDRWKHIGRALRLDPSQLKKIEKENRDLDDCLIEMLTLWLNKNYNTKRFGEPSWELLASAVKDRAGGNNAALAETITQTYGGIILSCVFCSFQQISLLPLHLPLRWCFPLSSSSVAGAVLLKDSVCVCVLCL